jgi:hypothetical protein
MSNTSGGCLQYCDFVLRRAGKSFIQLLHESGVEDCRAAITSDALIPLLKADPALIEGSLLWSMNKRTSSGWYFQRAQGAYVVGFYPDGEPLRFEDASRGCAEFGRSGR